MLGDSMKKNKNNFLNIKNILRYCVSIFVLLIIFLMVDLEELILNLKKIDISALIPCFFLLLFQLFFQTIRWGIFLKLQNIKISIFKLIQIYWAGITFNQILPSSIGGDLVRIGLTKNKDIKIVDVTTSIFLERLIGLIVLSLMALISFYVFGVYNKLFNYSFIISILPLVIILIPVCIIYFKNFITNFIKIRFINDLFNLINFGLINLYKHKKETFYIINLSFLAHLTFIIVFLITINNITGLNNYFELFSIISFVMIITAIPISLGGWGLRELSLISVLLPFGVRPESAIAIGIITGLILLFFSIPGILFIKFNE